MSEPLVSKSSLIFNIVVSYALLITTIVLAFNSAWLPAIWFALVWTGWTNNNGSFIRTRIMLLKK